MPVLNLEPLVLLPPNPAVPELDLLCHREVITECFLLVLFICM